MNKLVVCAFIVIFGVITLYNSLYVAKILTSANVEADTKDPMSGLHSKFGVTLKGQGREEELESREQKIEIKEKELDQNVAAFLKQQSLLNSVRCSTAELRVDKRPMINFFSSAVGEKYEDLLPIYAFYALSSHHFIGAFVEIVVSDSVKFVQRHNASLSWLQNTFSSNDTTAVCVRDYSSDHKRRTHTTNTWRFLEVPIRTAKYTYIGDVDLFLTESILNSSRMEQMEFFGLPYSNIVRNYNVEPGERRLTGLMLVETERFYTPALIKAQATVNAIGNDEVFLYKIVVEAGIGIPDPNTTSKFLKYRPGHGIHLSFNRGPRRRMCHAISTEKIGLLQHGIQVESYLRSDHFGERFFSTIAVQVQEEERMNMKIINGTCQSNHTALKVLTTNASAEVLTF